MSVCIETAEELQTLLRKLGVRVSSVEELHNLLASLNAQYNPQAARIRTAKLVAITVPCSLGGIAGGTSMLLALFAHGLWTSPYLVAALAVIWGCVALVSVMALIFGLAVLFGRQTQVGAERPSAKKPSAVEDRVMTAITSDLSV